MDDIVTSTARLIDRAELIKIVESRIANASLVSAQTVTNEKMKVAVKINFKGRPFFQNFKMFDYEFEQTIPALRQHGLRVEWGERIENGFLPHVGMPVTIGIGSDAYPARVFHVTPQGFKCRELDTVIISGSEADGSAVYEYRPHKDEDHGANWSCSLSKRDGLYRVHGAKQIIGLGYARKYRDPNF